jgi:hypothetical protein
LTQQINPMTPTKLQQIITELETTNSPQEAYFAINTFGGGHDESYIQANKQGLELFAAQLLKASHDFDAAKESKEQSVIDLDYEQEWIDGEVIIQYVQPANKPEVSNESTATSIREKLGTGCMIIAVIVIITAFVTGLVTMVILIFIAPQPAQTTA